MTIALLWPPDSPLTCELPVGRLRLRGHAPTASVSGYAPPPEVVVDFRGGAPILKVPDALRCLLPPGRLRFTGHAIGSHATAHRRATLRTGRTRFAGFRPTAQVRYSEERQAEEDEVLALFCMLMQEGGNGTTLCTPINP